MTYSDRLTDWSIVVGTGGVGGAETLVAHGLLVFLCHFACIFNSNNIINS